MKKRTLIGDWIALEPEEVKVGKFDIDSIKAGKENAIIVGIGPEVKNKELKIGDRVIYASWGIQVSSFEGKTRIYISESRNAIMEKV